MYRIHRLLSGIALLLGALLCHSVLAQETVAGAQNEASAARELGRVRFIDVPVPLGAGRESPMPGKATSVLGESQARQRREAIAGYSARVIELESAGGVWDQGLVEELAALGRAQQELGEHEAAVEALSRALHVNRINAGLHSMDQVPVVEALIESYSALGEWAQADLYQNYLYYVQRRAYGMDDPRMIPVLEKFGRWNLEAFIIGVGEPLGLRLSSAQLLFNAAKSLVGTHFGREDERYVAYLHHVARSAYLTAQHPEFVAEADRPQYRATQEQLRDTLMASGQVPGRGFVTGVEALEEIVAYYQEEGDEPYRQAEALANLADWQLMFGRRNTARDVYRQAWEVLADEENASELQARLFGQVRPIPTFAELPTNLLLNDTGNGERADLSMGYIDVRLDVTRFGATRALEVISEETEANARQFSQLRREIRDTLFRPLIVEGEPVDSGGHVFRYRYWY